MFINTCVQIIILVFSAHELASGRITLGSCMLFVYICQKVVKPISDISAATLVVQRMITASERVIGYMRTAPSIKDGAEHPAGIKTSIRLEGVSFAYDRRAVLRSISLDIRKGEMIALVGPSGAGKSTLVDLILRFYDPTEGRILLDGVDIRNFQQREYRRMFGIVSQESMLFNATVRENIAYGRQGLTEEQIARACDMSHVTEFIPSLPHGLDSMLGDRGVRLSGGQRQRLSIARALVSNPAILILDEATSALDSESEKIVKDAIDQVTKNTTSIVVAHRLSTIMHANRIVVLENGVIVGIGPHADLIETCPLYRKLCHLQFNIQSEQVPVLV
jgi:subfamily B ATP-binding cassette protein MsbA